MVLAYMRALQCIPVNLTWAPRFSAFLEERQNSIGEYVVVILMVYWYFLSDGLTSEGDVVGSDF